MDLRKKKKQYQEKSALNSFDMYTKKNPEKNLNQGKKNARDDSAMTKSQVLILFAVYPFLVVMGK